MSESSIKGSSIVHPCDNSNHPHLRLLHYNDVYHIELRMKASSGSAEPVGGIARFQTVVDSYREHEDARHSELLTFFSGDAFNPSLESSVTKGQHMVAFLNATRTDVACVGNHDLDFGIDQFQHLRDQCKFPWLLANVLDPALGADTPLAGCKKTLIMTSSNGIRIGVIGLAEREWLETVNALPPNLIYKSASATAEDLAPELRKQGCELIVALTHMREPNDLKLAGNTSPGLIDLVLGGHDHYYNHTLVNKTHVLRSGTDFRQLSYIEAWKDSGKWDFRITRRDIVRSLPEDSRALAMVNRLTVSLKHKLEKPIGYTATPLDGRFTTVRTKESNLGNFVCDLMRFYHQTDCALMAAGTIRGDQVYPPGLLRMKDIMNCFPFEDPVVVLRLCGTDILAALENSVSLVPALEGRFPQVSNIEFEFHPDSPSGSRIKWARINGYPLELHRVYTMATRGYMARGKDGFASLVPRSAGGPAEEIVNEENGVLISTILRQYFLSLKVMGTWHRWGSNLRSHWARVHHHLHQNGRIVEPLKSEKGSPKHDAGRGVKRKRRVSQFDQHVGSDSDQDEIDYQTIDVSTRKLGPGSGEQEADYRFHLAKSVVRKWMRLTGIQRTAADLVDDADEDFTPAWTKGIAPQLEGRIRRTISKGDC